MGAVQGDPAESNGIQGLLPGIRQTNVPQMSMSWQGMGRVKKS